MDLCYNGRDQIIYIPIEMIYLGAYQPRKRVDTQRLMSLAESVKKYGILQPVCVRFVSEGRYELATGERRLRAARLAGVDMIPAVVVNVRDKDAAVIGLIENLQREQLDVFEEADGVERLGEIFGYSPEEIGKIIGADTERTKRLKIIAELSEEVRCILSETEYVEEYGEIVAGINGEKGRLKAAECVKKFNPGINGAKKLAAALNTDESIEVTADFFKPRVKRYIKDVRIFENTIKKAVGIFKEAGMDIEVKEEREDGLSRISLTARGV